MADSMDNTVPSRSVRSLLRVSAFLKLQQWWGEQGKELHQRLVLPWSLMAQHSCDITLVMGASIVMEWTLAMEERRRWELPVSKTEQNLYPDCRDKAGLEDQPGTPEAFSALLALLCLSETIYCRMHNCKEMLAEPLMSLIRDKWL